MIGKLVLGIAMSFAVAGTAYAAAKRCPPVPVGQGQVCDCIARNYGATADTGVTITVLGAAFGPVTCGPANLDPGLDRNCAVTNDASFIRCGCVVTGAASSTKVSLSVEGPANNDGAIATVACE